MEICVYLTKISDLVSSRSRQRNKLLIRAIRSFSIVDFMNKQSKLQEDYRFAEGTGDRTGVQEDVDIVASATANLASRLVEDNKSVNKRASFKKTLSTTISEQVKTFSKVPLKFCWPSYKKKSMEPPKERCGWCAS